MSYFQQYQELQKRLLEVTTVNGWGSIIAKEAHFAEWRKIRKKLLTLRSINEVKLVSDLEY